MLVADLLAQSRAAHAAYRRLANDPARCKDFAAQDAQITIARDARMAAHNLDPQLVEPTWLADRALNKGLSSDDLIRFYTKTLEQAR